MVISKKIKLLNEGSSTVILVDGEKYSAENEADLINALILAKNNPDNESRL